MTKNVDFPACIANPKQANKFAELYFGDGPTPREKLRSLELQALFFLLVEALETPDMDFKELVLLVPDDPDDTVWINIKGADGDELDIADESEEVGAAAVLLMREIGVDHEDVFMKTLANDPLTHENKWDMATRLFGEALSAQMQSDYLAKSTPKARGNPRARM